MNNIIDMANELGIELDEEVLTREDLLTSKEVQELLKISEPHLRTISKKNNFKVIKDKLNKTYTYYLKDEIIEFIENRYYVIKE